MRPADQEMTASGKIACYSQIPRRGDTPGHVEPHEEAPRLVRRQMEQEENRPFIQVPTGRASRLSIV